MDKIISYYVISDDHVFANADALVYTEYRNEIFVCYQDEKYWECETKTGKISSFELRMFLDQIGSLNADIRSIIVEDYMRNTHIYVRNSNILVKYNSVRKNIQHIRDDIFIGVFGSSVFKLSLADFKEKQLLSGDGIIIRLFEHNDRNGCLLHSFPESSNIYITTEGNIIEETTDEIAIYDVNLFAGAGNPEIIRMRKQQSGKSSFFCTHTIGDIIRIHTHRLLPGSIINNYIYIDYKNRKILGIFDTPGTFYCIGTGKIYKLSGNKLFMLRDDKTVRIFPEVDELYMKNLDTYHSRITERWIASLTGNILLLLDLVESKFTFYLFPDVVQPTRNISGNVWFSDVFLYLMETKSEKNNRIFTILLGNIFPRNLGAFRVLPPKCRENINLLILVHRFAGETQLSRLPRDQLYIILQFYAELFFHSDFR